jgi:hypothetical protein
LDQDAVFLTNVSLFSQDPEKYAVWEKERMPQLLLQIEASSKKSNKKQKKWARKAMVKSEIEVSKVSSV